MFLIDYIVAKRKYAKDKKRREKQYNIQTINKCTKNSICKKCKFVYVNDYYRVKCGIINIYIYKDSEIKECKYFKEKKEYGKR